MKYIDYNKETGEIIGFYSEYIHGDFYLKDEEGNISEDDDGNPINNPDCTIPDLTIEITDEEWIDCINQPGEWEVDIVLKNLVYIDIPSLSLDDLKQQKLNELKYHTGNLLLQTDYILIKFQEYNILELDTTSLFDKYFSVLDSRQSIRQTNDEMEQSIADAQTVEELDAIIIN